MLMAPVAPPGRRSLDSSSVDISVGSRFHAFDLARELQVRGLLRALYTGYPRWAARRFGLLGATVHPIPVYEPLNRLLGLLMRRGIRTGRLPQMLSDRFDHSVTRLLQPGGSIFVGWSSQCRRSLRRAKALGMKTVVERGSSHILWQRDQLMEEADALGGGPAGAHASTIAAELDEYATADYIAVPTEFVVQTFVERGVPREKLLVNPYGVDLQRFVPPAGRPASRETLRVLHCGQVSARKGVHYLAEAIQLVPGAELRCVGALHAGMVHRLRQPRITLLGAVSGAEVPAHYAWADVFALLSIEEGMALVLAQAMASGLPVVATPNTGAGEFITDGVEGFLVPPRDPKAAAQKIEWLLRHPAERLAMGRRARERVCRGYSWSDYGDRAVKNYERILAS